MAMEIPFVIKVKYGDDLRRFNVLVDDYGPLDLNIAGLRSKIRSLFNLPPDADITMKYVDEDGDIITLVEDEDLCDAVRQPLKFLRIDVLVNGEKDANFSRSSGTSTPLRSPRVQNSSPNINAIVTEALKLVPEPLKEAVAKLSIDLASKGPSTNPVLAELVELFTKLGQSYTSPLSQSQSSAYSTTVNTASKTPVAADTVVGPNVSKEEGIGNVTKGVGSTAFPAPPVHSHPSRYDTSGINWNVSRCPFSGMPLEDTIPAPLVPSSVDPFKRIFTISDAMGGILHNGICCDGCGVHPITGPRYKSNVKADYDLCSICFAKIGSEGDYTRMDRPAHYRYPRMSGGRYEHTKYIWDGSFPPVSRTCGLKSLPTRLDSRFISDVTVMDGTSMAPSTQFTKIWRMHNNGDFSWPLGTQLIWIGGDKLTDVVSIKLEIPEYGVPADGQVDIAVDFTAPELPGSYISYWMMASIAGQKFGQRVWVHIQVDASLLSSVYDNLGGINLNLPPDCSGAKDPQMVEGNEKPAVDVGLLDSTGSNKEADSLSPVVADQPKHDQSVNFPLNATMVGQGASAPPESPSQVSYPIIDTSGAAVPETSFVPYPVPVVESPALPVAVNKNNVVEQALLKELEEMGFKQMELNKEVLRNNEYNLGQSVDQLCGVGEWDPMLEELEEMGFSDTEMNKRLLEKNNGSLKHVVMDLINGHQV